ncbi:MAG: TetR/AcrR family transcriptional regulator, partial [Candidatus Eisenbacteria bacterium]|nr:TetR/AcrR family transcriptional regulator [Candidatus Eisenbacteria bacterium]
MVQKGRARETQILQAATRVFLERGKDGATMREIAARAGVNQALLHYYFRSKDRLYETVFSRQVDEFFGPFAEVIPRTDDLRQFLERFVSNYIDRLVAHPELPGFMLWEIKQGGATAGKLIRRKVFRGLKHGTPLDPVIQKAVRDGVIRPIDPANFILNLISMCVFPVVGRPVIERILPGVRVTSQEFLEKRKREILAMVWDGIRA